MLNFRYEKVWVVMYPICLLAIMLVSWGRPGHQVIALIAEQYLTPAAKDSVKLLLDGQSLADAASWADEVRNTPAYKNTAKWHYIELAPMLTYEYGRSFGFDKALKERQQEGDNIYSAILKQQDILKDKSSTKQQKSIALKFLICLVGDANQPMYINWDIDNYRYPARVIPAEKARQLQELWENNLIDGEGLSYPELAVKIDKQPLLIKKMTEAIMLATGLWKAITSVRG